MKWAVVAFCLLFALNNISAQTQEQIIHRGNNFCLSNTIIVKIKEHQLSVYDQETLVEHLNKKLKQPIIEKVRNAFSISKTLFKGTSSLQRIFFLTTNDNENPIEIIKQLSTLPEVEWAEPKYIRKVCYDPNDEFFVSGNQPHLNVIKAKEAWEITKGSKEIVIGIIDTGVDIDHPDLAANIFQNKNEIPGNGIDEDDSGEYIDDINGWDFGGLNGTPDNDPREDHTNKNGFHGTHVAGISSAVTDNFIGISSIGFNCTILPVKVSQDGYRDENDKPHIIFGFEGIKYAVDKGAKIISCSWGGYEYSKFEQEIIDYAVSNGVLVIAAAGNDNSNKPFYPASYRGVLSVGWTNNDDTKSIASNYGEFVNVMAPGTAIYSTWPTISGQNPPFNFAGGSSMSAPLVAGLAGLVISKYPKLTAEQVKERIRAACDSIDQKNLSLYNNLLGSGRINAFKAVNESEFHSLRATEVNFHTTQLEDTTAIEITFTNYLKPITNATVTISSKESFVKIIKQTFETGFLDELGTVKTANNNFLFTLTSEAPADTTIYFLLKYESRGYSDFQWIPVNINPSYRTHDNGKIIATVTNKGGLGFSDYKNKLKGKGFKYLSGNNLLNEGALLYGTSPNKLVDGVRIKEEQSNDFKVLKSISLKRNNSINEGYSLINDDNAKESKLGILTHFYSYSFNPAPDDSYIILHFVVENTTQAEIQNLFLGYFLDWNLSPTDYYSDSTAFNQSEKFAYAFNKKQNGTVVGAALLSSQSLSYMGINNNWRVGEVIFEDGFDDGEKWYSISNGIVNSGVNGDVSFIVSGGPVNILPKEKEKFTFVIAAASNKEELRYVIRKSRDKYNSFISSVAANDQPIPYNNILHQNYPNPFNPSTVISYQLSEVGFVILRVYDILGREVATLVNEFKTPGLYNSEFSIRQTNGGQVRNNQLSSGVYFYRLQVFSLDGNGEYVQTKKMVLLK
jgi:subtilisin family serine protease